MNALGVVQQVSVHLLLAEKDIISKALGGQAISGGGSALLSLIIRSGMADSLSLNLSPAIAKFIKDELILTAQKSDVWKDRLAQVVLEDIVIRVAEQ